jgi:hypothetical protein
MKHLLKSSPATKLAFTAIVLSLLSSSCKKDDPTPDEPANEEEVITTFVFKITDSTTNTTTTYFFKDPDGDGGTAPFYGPTAAAQSDSVLKLQANKTYFVVVELLDETKSPVETISTEVNNEGEEHMLFYNNGSNTVVNSSNPFTVKMNGSDMTIKYTDLDTGSPQRGIGLTTRWRTSGTGKFPLNIVLRHQPGTKDGTYAPGDTDISIDFKYEVN